MNNIYVLLDETRASIISMDLSYSRTTELLNQILEIEKAVGRDCSLKPQGEWKLDNLGAYCSECGIHPDYTSNYCPNCGASMKGDSKEWQ